MVFEKVKEILCDQLDLDEEKVTMEASITEDLGADSLTLMQITIELLEKNYVVNIQDIYEHKTIREIAENFSSDKPKKEEKMASNVYYKFNEDFSEQKISEKNVLLTGSTGYLGIHILYELLKKTDANVYCIIRKKNGEPVTERLKENVISIKDKSEHAYKDDSYSGNEYATNKIQNTEKQIAKRGTEEFNRQGIKSVKDTKENFRKAKNQVEAYRTRAKEKAAAKKAKGMIKSKDNLKRVKGSIKT